MVKYFAIKLFSSDAEADVVTSTLKLSLLPVIYAKSEIMNYLYYIILH